MNKQVWVGLDVLAGAAETVVHYRYCNTPEMLHSVLVECNIWHQMMHITVEMSECCILRCTYLTPRCLQKEDGSPLLQPVEGGGEEEGTSKSCLCFQKRYPEFTTDSALLVVVMLKSVVYKMIRVYFPPCHLTCICGKNG